MFVGKNRNPLNNINLKAFNLATKNALFMTFAKHRQVYTTSIPPLFTQKIVWIRSTRNGKKYAHLNSDHLFGHANKLEFGTLVKEPKLKLMVYLVTY